MSKRNLATIDTDMFTPIGRLLQQAMAHGIENDMVYGGLETGQTALQGLYVEAATQNCKIGTRRVTWDGRVFKYGLAGETLSLGMKFGVKNANYLVQKYEVTCAAAAKGAESVTVTFNGEFWDTEIDANELLGGFISIYNSSTVRDTRMILTNDAVVAGGGACVIGLDGPLSATFAAAVGCEVMANPYIKLYQENSGTSAVVGLPNVLATDTYYFWSQTWGIRRITPTGAELGGNNVPQKQLCFDNAGAVMTHEADHDAENASYQHAGFFIERVDQATAGSAAPFVMIQISP